MIKNKRFVHQEGVAELMRVTDMEPGATEGSKNVFIISEVYGEACINVVSEEYVKTNNIKIGGYLGHVEILTKKPIYMDSEEFEEHYKPFPADECEVVNE